MTIQKALNSLGVVFFPAFDWSISPTHPEREERLLYTQDQLWEEGLFDIKGINEFKAGVAGDKDVLRTHFCFPDLAAVCTPSHLVSAGGAIEIARLLKAGRIDKGFALVRPPGHHAMKCVHGSRGFCNINIEAVMIEWLRANYGQMRIAVVDTDCHHGDGTQDIFWHDPDVLFISLHQDGRTLYPGSGFSEECGGPGARGKTINIPLPPYTGDKGYLYAIEHCVLPLLDDFKPDIIVNSAGQDNHYSDPITNMNFSAQGYARMTELLNPDLAVLEGGYSIQSALPYVNLGICLALAGLDYSHVREPDYTKLKSSQNEETDQYIKTLCAQTTALYRKPPVNREYRREGDWWVRERDIYYDTDGISEHQKDSVFNCSHCSGVVVRDSTSSRAAGCKGIQIPWGGCEKCVQRGKEIYSDASKDSAFGHVQLIDNSDKSIGK